MTKDSEQLVLQRALSRREVVTLARTILKQAKLPAGARAVIVVTGPDGSHVGVASNTSGQDIRAMLVCAVNGLEYFQPDIVDMPEAEEPQQLRAGPPKKLRSWASWVRASFELLEG